MANDQKAINDLFELLKLEPNEEAHYPDFFDTTTPFEQCGLNISIPTTISNSTTVANSLK
jgi:hypothetical protein